MTTTNATGAMPANILLDKWADIGFAWQGVVHSSELARLSESLSADSALEVSCRLEKVDGILWLSFEVAGALMLPCQRCLEALSIDVSGEYRTAILYRSADVSRIDDAEYLLVDELGEDTRKLPIRELLEDELMLALPLSPRHDDCQMLADSVGELAEEDEVQDNPFAALAALKGNLAN